MFKKNSWLRNIVQIVFALLTLYIGVKFYLFTEHYLSLKPSPEVSRPPGVEAFLPISALVAFKAWLATGVFDKIHPAGLVIFLTIIVISILFKKAFCSWICPFGALSEGLAGAGKFFFGRNFKLPKFLDYPVRSLKYLILLFFLNAILFGMSGIQAAAFLKSPYNMIADVKMLQFFQNLSGTSLIIIGFLLILSVLFENFWCRYLCPYGALLGALSIISPFKVSRDRETCIDCGACTKACPNRIEVAKADRVWSPECTGCLNCVNSCPVKGTLEFKAAIKKLVLSPKVMAVAVIGTWIAFVVAAKLTGHWETSITPEIYAKLIPIASRFGH